MLEDEHKQMSEWEARHTFTDSFRSTAEVSYISLRLKILLIYQFFSNDLTYCMYMYMCTYERCHALILNSASTK